MIAVDMPVALRQMIDARLDNIERALMTQQMGRGDRHQILSAIEDQILEMLGRSAGEEPTRDDVLSILAKLDPPEAYLEVSDTRSGEFSTLVQGDHRRMDADAVRLSGAEKDVSTLAVIGFVLTCVACVGAFSWWILDFYGLMLLAILTTAAGIFGNVALCQFIQHRHSQRGLWMAVTASSSAPIVALLSCATYVVLLMIN
jgi:hypothetical protein